MEGKTCKIKAAEAVMESEWFASDLCQFSRTSPHGTPGQVAQQGLGWRYGKMLLNSGLETYYDWACNANIFYIKILMPSEWNCLVQAPFLFEELIWILNA